MLPELTVMVITYNEEANIERTLSSVSWAGRILVVDSGSTDKTLDTIGRYPQADVITRPFTTFADQCNFGLSHVTTPWVLSIDADYVFPPGAESEIRAALADAEKAGFTVPFAYAIYGKVVRGSILPPRTVLYRQADARYVADGHGHRVIVDGPVGVLPFSVVHDDRKPLSRWLSSQINYARIEAEKLASTPFSSLGFADKTRRLIFIAPLLVFVLVYFLKGGFLSGWAGFCYACQRFYAEFLLSLFLVDGKARGFKSDET